MHGGRQPQSAALADVDAGTMRAGDSVNALPSKVIAAASNDAGQDKGATGAASHAGDAVAAQGQKAGQQQAQGVVSAQQDPGTKPQTLPKPVSVTR